MTLHVYLPRNRFTYLLNSQSATLSLSRDAREEMSTYYLKCKQSVKDDCQETAQPRCLKATAVCCHKMPAGENVHTRPWFSNFGMHPNHLEGDSVAAQNAGPTPTVPYPAGLQCGLRTCISNKGWAADEPGTTPGEPPGQALSPAHEHWGQLNLTGD